MIKPESMMKVAIARGDAKHMPVFNLYLRRPALHTAYVPMCANWSQNLPDVSDMSGLQDHD